MPPQKKRAARRDPATSAVKKTRTESTTDATGKKSVEPEPDTEYFGEMELLDVGVRIVSDVSTTIKYN